MKNKVSLWIVLMFCPIFTSADCVMSLRGIFVFGIIFFIFIGFLLYGLNNDLAKNGSKSKIDSKDNYQE